MEIVIAKDQPMQYQPRAKDIIKGFVVRHDFLVKCQPQDLVSKGGQDPMTWSQVMQFEDLAGTIRVFMGPSIYYSDQNEYYCGLWIRDLGGFFKKLFLIVKEDSAKLIATVKHQGQPLGNTWNKGNEFRLDLHREDSSNPRTQVKCPNMDTIMPAQGDHGFSQFFHEVTSDSFTITMTLKFDP